MTALPNKLHELLRVGIDDLKKLEKLPHTSVEMGEWFTVGNHLETPECLACMAGGCMYFELGLNNKVKDSVKQKRSIEYLPDMYPIEVESKLRALNSLRIGNVNVAARYLNHPRTDTLENFYVPEYCRDRAGFYRKLEEMYDYLKDENV